MMDPTGAEKQTWAAGTPQDDLSHNIHFSGEEHYEDDSQNDEATDGIEETKSGNQTEVKRRRSRHVHFPTPPVSGAFGDDDVPKDEQSEQETRTPDKTDGASKETEAAGSAGSSFAPTHEVFAPTKMNNVQHRPVAMRASIPSELLGQKGSSAANPDSRDILRRVSIVLANHILRGEHMRQRERIQTASQAGHDPKSRSQLRREARRKVSRQFSEEFFVKPQRRYHLAELPGIHLLTCFSVAVLRPRYHLPSHRTIFQFIERLFTRAKLHSGCSIVCLVYVERLMEKTGLHLLARNWRPIMLCSMLIASKMWQDTGAWNVEFSRIYPQFPISSLNRAERLFVKKIEWNTIISAGVYARYYFALRSMNEKKQFRNKYLDMLGVRPALPQATRIEARSREKTAMILSRSM